MLPVSLVSRASDLVGGEIVPRWLGERDHAWIRVLLDEHERYVGRRRAELAARLREPLSARCPKAKLDLAVAVLDRLSPPRVAGPLRPRDVRAVAFHAAARGGPAAALAEAARILDVPPEAVDEALFADLPGERRVRSLASVSPAALADEVNLAIAGTLLARSSVVRVQVPDDGAALIRRARHLGLVCTVVDTPRELSISGPFSLFRRTALYGRALAALAGELAGCEDWKLAASCSLPSGPGELVFVLGPDLLPASRRTGIPDHPLVERLARELTSLLPDWRISRDPPPLRAAGVLAFPDLEIAHGTDPARRWYLEIAGFWTQDWLRARAAFEHLVVCVDSRRSCDEDAPGAPYVVPYRQRVDARVVARIVVAG